jgi:septal ring factor EnvC (AmiA/AmiB activator)
MKYQSIADYVATLSAKEKEENRSLIEESITREETLKQTRIENKRALRELEKSFEELTQSLTSLNETAKVIDKNTETYATILCLNYVARKQSLKSSYENTQPHGR